MAFTTQLVRHRHFDFTAVHAIPYQDHARPEASPHAHTYELVISTTSPAGSEPSRRVDDWVRRYLMTPDFGRSFDFPTTLDELTRYLAEAFHIIDSELLGVALRMDRAFGVTVDIAELD